VIQETYIHVQQRLAMQSLERKLSMQNRSYIQLIKILRKKLDDEMIVGIFDEMESVEPGSTQYLKIEDIAEPVDDGEEEQMISH
jgi:hypothetical protein